MKDVKRAGSQTAASPRRTTEAVPVLDADAEFNLRIIELLQEDGRMPFSTIAEKLGVSEGTVRNRVKQLRDDNVMQIIQAPDHIVLVTDFWRRVVPLDGRRQVAGTLRSWGGTSRGRWDGDTLVIETRHFNDRLPSLAGVGDGREKVVTERLTRTAANRIDYSATVVDPKSFKDRVELSFPMANVKSRVLDFACHEGNYSMRNSLSAARLADAKPFK